MIHLFKTDPNGQWQTDAGERYTVVCVKDASKHPKKAGWCESLNGAIEANIRKQLKKKATFNESTDAI